MWWVVGGLGEEAGEVDDRWPACSLTVDVLSRRLIPLHLHGLVDGCGLQQARPTRRRASRRRRRRGLRAAAAARMWVPACMHISIIICQLKEGRGCGCLHACTYLLYVKQKMTQGPPRSPSLSVCLPIDVYVCLCTYVHTHEAARPTHTTHPPYIHTPAGGGEAGGALDQERQPQQAQGLAEGAGEEKTRKRIGG